MKKNFSFKLLLVLLFIGFFVAPALFSQEESLGKAEVTYKLYRIPKIASNQLAVWIEKTDGE